jgi:hypothetical protein
MANNRLTVGCYRADSRLLQPASRSPPRSLPVASARGRALLRDQGCGSCSRKIASHLATATRTPPGPRPALRPRARERRPGRIRCAGPSDFPAAAPVSIADSPSPPKAPPHGAEPHRCCHGGR